MGIFEIKNLTFTYPDREKPGLCDVSFSVGKGEFVALCGASGSGKTTLLRLLKPELAPAGRQEGKILYGDRCSKKEKSWTKVGFVLQNPEHQIVTDKVWSELAFGPENLGWKKELIGIRVAEIAAYFGIQHWFRKEIKELSGGQKQLLNLAAVMVMNPEVLLLDEPTAQLDPVAAEEFLDAVIKINREMGTTIIITEHRLDSVIPACDRMLVLDKGKLIVDDIPQKGMCRLSEKKHPMVFSMPAVSRTYLAIERTEVSRQHAAENLPMNVRQGKRWIVNLLENRELPWKQIEEKEQKNTPIALQLKNLWFRYHRHDNDVLRGLSMDIHKGQTVVIVGGNGSGKSTLLRVICGTGTPYSGKVKKYVKKILLMPQDPQSVFASETVKAELSEMVHQGTSVQDDSKTVAELLHIEDVLNSHPYDISGGEQQRVVLGKILLANPDVILMDEPTKGMDSAFKRELADILLRLKQQGKTIVMVSHDIEFCAMYADYCAMLFDGNIVSAGTARELFSGNRFYTTAAGKISGEYFSNAITPEDIAGLVKKNLAPYEETVRKNRIEEEMKSERQEERQ